jgi:hypothetical protein
MAGSQLCKGIHEQIQRSKREGRAALEVGAMIAIKDCGLDGLWRFEQAAC